MEGENNAKILIADSDAIRREREAEAARKAIAAEKVQAAKALEEAYMAEKEAEIARAEREKATQAANIVVPAQIDKEKAIIDAEAEAERLRRLAKGEADAFLPRWMLRHEVYTSADKTGGRICPNRESRRRRSRQGGDDVDYR
ncbi:MAG: hypothetical protein ACLU4N_18560 [Butyricimonas faecihominis]